MLAYMHICAFLPPFVCCFQTWPAFNPMRLIAKKVGNETRQSGVRAWRLKGAVLACVQCAYIVYAFVPSFE